MQSLIHGRCENGHATILEVNMEISKNEISISK